jgi:hypothetical protein
MKTIREKVLEQIKLAEEIQKVAGINIVNCGNCGEVLLHRITEDEDIECPYCDFKSEPCNFPDFLYSGMETSEAFDEEPVATENLLDDAVNKITMDMVKGLQYGEELELNAEYTLYHYTEDDIIVLNRTEDWEELYQILFEDDKIIFEKL